MVNDNKSVLLVDDEVFFANLVAGALMVEGLTVFTARTLMEAKEMLRKHEKDIGFVILDVWLPVGEPHDLNTSEEVLTRGGFRGGQVLATWIKTNYPDIRFLAYTSSGEKEVDDWFSQNSDGYFRKILVSESQLTKNICRFMGKTPAYGPKCFIVHGHDKESIYELKNYLQNTLKFPEPVILKEQASGGLTIIEKFEEYVENVDLVFILLTPDDMVSYGESGTESTHRARQNVIFEMGYFLGKFGRKRGRVILLCKGIVELPSDISGWLSIDISNGINVAGIKIQKEIKRLFPLTFL